MTIEINGRYLETDEEGYLRNISDWTPEVAELMSRMDGLELSEDHWEIIHFLRNYYDEFHVAPAVRILTREIGKKLGKDKGNSQYLFQLYPSGPARQACRYAGLPKLSGCI